MKNTISMVVFKQPKTDVTTTPLFVGETKRFIADVKAGVLDGKLPLINGTEIVLIGEYDVITNQVIDLKNKTIYKVKKGVKDEK